MIFVLLIGQVLAFWPFDSTLDAETSQKIVQATIIELGAGEEEALLLTKAYLEANAKISMESLVNDIQEQRFSGFIHEWRASLFKNIVSDEALKLSKLVENPPFTFELYKALTMSFDDFYSTSAEEVEEGVEEIGCPDGSKSSFKI